MTSDFTKNHLRTRRSTWNAPELSRNATLSPSNPGERKEKKKNRPTSPFLIDMFHIAEINLCLCDWIWDLLIANLGEHRSVDHGVFLNYHNLFML